MEGAKFQPIVKTVQLSELWANPWNPNQQTAFMYQKQRRSLKKFGLVEDVVVRQAIGPKGEPYQLINGEHRWKAAIDEGFKEIEVKDLGVVPDATAKELTLLLNEIHGSANPVKTAQLLQDLTKDIDLPEIVLDIPMPEGQIMAYLQMTNFEQAFETPTTDDKGKPDVAKFSFALSPAKGKRVNAILNRRAEQCGDKNEAFYQLCTRSRRKRTK
jgi:hypothetical protein